MECLPRSAGIHRPGVHLVVGSRKWDLGSKRPSKTPRGRDLRSCRGGSRAPVCAIRRDEALRRVGDGESGYLLRHEARPRFAVHLRRHVAGVPDCHAPARGCRRRTQPRVTWRRGGIMLLCPGRRSREHARLKAAAEPAVCRARGCGARRTAALHPRATARHEAARARIGRRCDDRGSQMEGLVKRPYGPAARRRRGAAAVANAQPKRLASGPAGCSTRGGGGDGARSMRRGPKTRRAAHQSSESRSGCRLRSRRCSVGL